MVAERRFDTRRGRTARRKFRLLTGISWLEVRKEWKGVVHEHTRHFITTLTGVREFAHAV